MRRIQLSRLSKEISDSFDLFICCNSFDKRSLSIPRCISLDSFANYVVFTNEVMHANAQENLSSLRNILGEKAHIVQIPFSSPVVVADKLSETIRSIAENHTLSSVFIDITTFTHEVLLILIAILHKQYPNIKIFYGYANAEDYGCDNQCIDDVWLSSGVGDIRSVLGYSGEWRPSQKDALIVIIGYEHERATEIINSLEPNFLVLVYGIASDSTTEQNRDANEQYAQLVKQMATSYDSISEFRISCNDLQKAYIEIESQILKIGFDKNITIVPMNNKITTVAAALVALAYPSIQLCYAPALRYNYNSYSRPGTSCYLFGEEV